MAMKSKYTSTCKRCGKLIRKDIDWIDKKDNVWGHVQCPTNTMGALSSSVKTANNYQSTVDTVVPLDLDALAASLEPAKIEVKQEKEFIPSGYQQAIFDAVTAMVNNVSDFVHLVIEAVAGSGKTTTIVKSLELIPSHFSVLFVAFNKHIAEPLSQKLQAKGVTNVKASTLHSAGLANFRKAYPNFVPMRDIEEDKVGVILEDHYPVRRDNVKKLGISKEQKKRHYEKRQAMRSLVSMSKNTLIDYNNEEEVLYLIDRYNIDIDPADIRELVDLLPTVMERCKEWIDKIDFDDMIWLPIVLNLNLEKFDYLMVDEAQDLNKLQIVYILRSIKENGHIIAVGDRYQSLYAFRGADADAIPNIIEALSAKVLPLSVTYRCPALHVKQAQLIVPHLEARENAPDGVIGEIEYNDLSTIVQSGDMVICRTNAPLVKPAFACIRRGVKAVIRGRSIGDELIALIKQFETDDMGLFEANLMQYYQAKFDKLLEHGKEMQATAFRDKVETLLLIMNECSTMVELDSRIKLLFSDKDTGVIFSSVHRAKGLEAERVFILRPELMPFPKAEKEHEIQQEMNCKYVAETRSKDQLYYVKGGDNV